MLKSKFNQSVLSLRELASDKVARERQGKGRLFGAMPTLWTCGECKSEQSIWDYRKDDRSFQKCNCGKTIESPYAYFKAYFSACLPAISENDVIIFAETSRLQALEIIEEIEFPEDVAEDTTIAMFTPVQIYKIGFNRARVIIKKRLGGDE